MKRFGPFSYHDSCPGPVRELIDPNLKENESYTLTVIIETQSQNITSYKHSFSEFIFVLHMACT